MSEASYNRPVQCGRGRSALASTLLSPFPILLLAAALALQGCGGLEKRPPVSHLNSADSVVCADLGRLPQNLNAYLSPAAADQGVLDAAYLNEAGARAKKLLFAPWLGREGGKKRTPPSEAMWALTGMNPAQGFAENLRPYPRERWDALVENCDPTGYGAVVPRPLPAITVADASLRLMPTDTPFFKNPEEAGEGYPFDMYQNSTLWIGMPVSIIHKSRDRAWVLVETALVSGWVRAEQVAEVDARLMEAWTGAPLAVIIRDSTPLGEARGLMPGRYAHVGTVLPCLQRGPDLEVSFPVRADDGRAVSGSRRLPSEYARPWPMPMTQRNVALIGNELIGKPYGWGGYLSNRDCSSLTRDIFMCFGLWLPRNSKSQAAVGAKTDLAGLAPDAKEKAILDQGVPFASLIGLPGHIALYLGQYQGEAVIFHSIWGLRTSTDEKDGQGKAVSARAVIGKAVITTLRPGVERRDIGDKNGILARVAGMNTPGAAR